MLYLSSRLPQIYLNWSRRSVEGLAIGMFVCALAANLCFGVGILLRAHSVHALIQQAPWIIGSLGTLCLDGVIVCQFAVFSKTRMAAVAAAVAAAQAPAADAAAVAAHDAVPLLPTPVAIQEPLLRSSAARSVAPNGQ